MLRKAMTRLPGVAMWRLNECTVLLARVQGSSHVRWLVTLADRGITISVSREQARLLLEAL
jgi:hypothetical protein